MKTCFSWLKKSIEDVDRVSSGASALFCLVLFAGTLVLSAEKLFLTPVHEAAEAIEESVPARIVVRLENFIPAPEISEIENAPEETPPAPEIPAPLPEPQPEPPPPEPVPEKIDETAIRETLQEELPPQEPPPEKEEPPPPEPEKLPEPEPQPEPPPPEPQPSEPAPPPPPVQQAAPTPPVPAPIENPAVKIAAEQTLYGALAEAVSRKKFYPKAARRNGRTGTVPVRVSLSSDGKISGYSVEKCAAHKSLIDGAEETLRRVAESFVAPAGTREALPAAFIVPIIYELN